jgi:hypothetical protein
MTPAPESSGSALVRLEREEREAWEGLAGALARASDDLAGTRELRRLVRAHPEAALIAGVGLGALLAPLAAPLLGRGIGLLRHVRALGELGVPRPRAGRQTRARARP